MKQLSYILLCLSSFLCVSNIFAQLRWSSEVSRVLEKAGTNRTSLESLLKKYRNCGDKERFEAACFLIGNMTENHVQEGHVIKIDSKIDSVIVAADEQYYQLIKGTSEEEQERDPLHKQLKDASAQASKRFQNMTVEEPEVEIEEMPDFLFIDGNFLERHIENAMKLRRRSKQLREMPFEEFCNVILPYRTLNSYPLVTNGADAHSIFDKYLKTDTPADINKLGMRYRRAIWWLRHWQGAYPFDTMIGFREMFFTGYQDCVDIANYATTIYRACGIPAYTEYNIAYKLWEGRHYMTTIQDADGKWYSHSPESELPTGGKGFERCLNIYRCHFGKQSQNPQALRAKSEQIPNDFWDYGIEDVTSHYTRTVSLDISLPDSLLTGRNLVYLASFQQNNGLIPITWGEINHKNKKATFKNVVDNHVYFPVFMNSNGFLHPFDMPFKLKDGKKEMLSQPTGHFVEVDIKRKFPRKPHLLRQAESTIGTIVLGSDNKDFREADTLAIIENVPEPEWEILPLKFSRPYQYYRVQAPQHDPHVYLAEIQFLSLHSHSYSNVTDTVCECISNPIYARLLDEPLDKCKWKREYDGNVQTAPDRWPHVTLNLREPQYVDAIAYIVKHADNGVKFGNKYLLQSWKEDGWSMEWMKIAENDCFKQERLEVGRLYWLSNLTRGKEELPFYVNSQGEVIFPHQWILEEFKH